VFSFNWTALTVFWSTWNTWRKLVQGKQVIREGIDWTQVESALKLSGIKRKEWRDIFECLQIMEAEALRYLNRG
jgi:hypothetical protein